jgi:CheY-like chemotaxis protein
VTIKDNGPGIKKENLSKIFDPFFTTKAKGNGLGLSAAYSIISNHDGTIRVESEEGKGATFTVTIPAITESFVAQEGSGEGSGNVSASAEDIGKIRVLWLDDEPFITKMAESILSSFGYQVTSTTSSKTALEFFRESVEEGRAFDIVVLDLKIKGGLGGKEVIRQMREWYPEITAVACSGYYDDPVMSDPCSYGFKCALRKPYTSEELHNVLQTAFGGR